ncbi:PepSY domain-containing protein [Ciceribacter sp. RN22]|uniref:PepSY domain-containing protein n=1 Tax=Ciceribacter sp. RN22 TaxID=2954932 RepID=UPI002092547C|nr:PepSY domain-containing protein [Ciceribacter sp. RN22]MCO6179172.1 PepSY domain-containing protein [Ciceribacter sp. RN22]
MSKRLGDWLSRLSLAGLVVTVLLATTPHVYADDDGHDDGHESSDSDSGDGGHDDGGGDDGGDGGSGGGGSSGGGSSSGRSGGSSSSGDRDDSRDRIQKAVALGKMKSLATLQKILRQRVSGDIVSVELLRRGRRPVYEFRVLKPNGRVVEVNIDAATGSILQIENN